MKTFDLAGLLEPTTVEEFLGGYCFQQPLLVRGASDKFADLFSWDALNRILSNSRHDAIRVHLDRVGSTPDDLDFTHDVTNVRGERLPRIDVPRLYRHLREGATLVIDAVNEVDPAVADVSEEVAAQLSAARATTVLFASFGHVPGFKVHWDNRDVYAVQVEGQKHWRVFEPSRVAPLGRGDSSVPDSGEPGPLRWEGVVEKGDLLYVPRGWWHEVTSTDAPSLHLNLGFAPLTGVDVLDSLIAGLRGSDLIRRDVPRFGTPDEIAAYERALKDAIGQRLAAFTMADFVASTRAGAPAQTHVSLPLGVTGAATPPGPGHLVRLTNRMATIGAALPADLAPLARRLETGDVVSVDELAGTVPDLPAGEVQALLGGLIGDGLVHLVQR